MSCHCGEILCFPHSSAVSNTYRTLRLKMNHLGSFMYHRRFDNFTCEAQFTHLEVVRLSLFITAVSCLCDSGGEEKLMSQFGLES